MPIDLALLGCAHPHVPDVLGIVASEPDLRLVAVWDADPSAVPGAVGALAVARAETAIRRADAVVVCAPVDQRPALCAQAAQAGRPLLVELPVAPSAAEARAVAREVERTRTPAAPALFLRHLPALGRLAGVLREGLLGRLAAVSATLAHPGSGGFGGLAPHLLDALASLPPGEPARLAAVVHDRAGARAEAGGMALGTWCDVPLAVAASTTARPHGLELVLTGEAGAAAVRDGTLELRGADGIPERWVGAPPDAGEAVRAFAAALRSRRFAPDGLRAVVRAHEAVEAAVPVI